MDRLGISESIERKVVTAVGIQFLVTVGIFLVPFLVSGTLSYVLSGALFLAVRRDLQHAAHRAARLCRPLRQLETGADAIASGEVDAVDAVGAKDASIALAGSDQPDEIRSLVNSFAEVERYLGTVSAQAESLATQEFDDPALDEDVPGAFGDSLDEMAANLEAYTTELESRSSTPSATRRDARDGDPTRDDRRRRRLATDEDRYVELVGNYNRLHARRDGRGGRVVHRRRRGRER